MSLWDDIKAWFQGVYDDLATALGKLDDVLGVSSAIQFHLDYIEKLLAPLKDVKDWVDDFDWPDWNTAIVNPIKAALPDLSKLWKFIDDFEFPDFADLLKTNVIDKLDAWASGLVGVDAKKPFWGEVTKKLDVWFSSLVGVDPALPFWDEVWAKLENKLDVWFSGKLGIDAAKPFWDELEKKIIALAVKSIDAVLDAVIPEPPEKKI